MEALAQKHAGLINGLTKLFDLLIAMRYISDAHVIRPLHTVDIIATELLQSAGFEHEVVDLVRIIPALRSDVTWGWQEQGIELLPESKAVTYFADVDDSVWISTLRCTEERYNLENTKLLPTWMLRLTAGDWCNWYYGMDLIYNTQDGKIIEWSQRGPSWDQSPSRLAEVVLLEIVEKLETLKWVPFFDPGGYHDPPYRHIVPDPLQSGYKIGLPDDPTPGLPSGLPFNAETYTGLESVREGINRNQALAKKYGRGSWREHTNYFRGLQNLYRRSGWGTEMFNGALFERRRAEFAKAWEELEHIFSSMLDQPPSPWGYNETAEARSFARELEDARSGIDDQDTAADAFSSRLDEFWAQWVGEDRV